MNIFNFIYVLSSTDSIVGEYYQVESSTKPAVFISLMMGIIASIFVGTGLSEFCSQIVA